MAGTFTESVVEEAALAWPAGLGYAVLHVPNIAADILGAAAFASPEGLHA